MKQGAHMGAFFNTAAWPFLSRSPRGGNGRSWSSPTIPGWTGLLMFGRHALWQQHVAPPSHRQDGQVDI
ncbi:hypothetical protein SB758_39785, partial [Burkholderia sp. SIMBA_013]